MFKINEEMFDVGVQALQRSYQKDLKYSVTTEDGSRHSEIRAIYPVYTLTLGNLNQNEYDRLYGTVNTYDDIFVVTLPDGQEEITFEASVEMGSDGLIFIEADGRRRWDGLSLTFTAVHPVGRDA